MTESLAVAHGEQFIYSANGRRDYRVTASPGCTALLPQNTLSGLLAGPNAERLKEPCHRQLVFTLEGVVAATTFTPDRDSFNRRTVHNHTILLREDDYRQLGGHPAVFDAAFTTDTPSAIASLDLAAAPQNLLDDILSVRQRLGDAAGAVLQAIACHNVTPAVTATIGLRANAGDRLALVHALLAVLPPSLRVISWTIDATAPAATAYGLVVREHWRTTVAATPTGFYDLDGLTESLPHLKLLHQKYGNLFSELTPHEWGIATQALNRLVDCSFTALTPLHRVRADRRDVIRRRILDAFRDKVLTP